jgi:serine/threonine protein kinase/predicted Zn-dependent protease
VTGFDERVAAEVIATGLLSPERLAQAQGELKSQPGVTLAQILALRYLDPSGVALLRERLVRTTAPDSGRAPVVEPASSADRIGAYEVIEELARGGAGIVYRARHPTLDRDVAIKVLLSGKRASERQRSRFLLEARATARLRHPGIVTVHDVGEDNDRPYLVLDFVPGGSLERKCKTEGALPWREGAEISRQIAEALHYAHEQLILHRDVKPANILLDPEGRPLLTDFGLAKTLSEDGQPKAAASGLTRTGEFVGTPSFMSPEQATGGRVDARADVYSLGATLYELVSGQPPFESDSLLGLIAQIVDVEAPLLRSVSTGVPLDLETICRTCLEKDPNDRYDTAQELADDLRRFLADEPIHAEPPSPWQRALKWQRRRPRLAAGLAATLVLALTSVVAGSWWISRERTSARAREQAARESERERLLGEARDAAATTLAALDSADGLGADERTAVGLDALQATQRWAALEPDSKDAAKALHRSAVFLGDVALESEQWALARRAYLQGVTGDEAKRHLSRVTLARNARDEATRVEVTQLLEKVESGELLDVPGGTTDAVFSLVRLAGPVTERLLIAALQRTTASLPDLTLEKQDLAAVCSEALGRLALGDASKAAEALEAHLEAETDPGRAIVVATALLRLQGAKALDAIDRARARLKMGGTYDVEISRRLKARGVVRPGALSPESVAASGDTPANMWRIARRQKDDGKLELAIATLTRLLSVVPGDWRTLQERARMNAGLHRYEECVADVDALFANPGDADPDTQAEWRMIRAAGLSSIGRAREALVDVEKAVAIRPDDGEFALVHGKTLYTLKRYRDAARAYDRALELSGIHQSQKAGMLSMRGRSLAKQGSWREAARDFEEVLRLNPSDPQARVFLAEARAELGDAGGALSEYSKGDDPTDVHALVSRGLFKSEHGDRVGALSDFDRAVRTLEREHPKRPLLQASVLCGRARVHDAMGKPDLADRDLDAALKLDRTNADVWIHRAVIRRERGDSAGALSDVAEGMRLGPSASMVYGAGETYFKAKLYEKSVKAFDVAIEADYKRDKALLIRGTAKAALGRLDEALEDMKEGAKSKDPVLAKQARNLVVVVNKKLAEQAKR